jgi:hypothetical protein
MPLGRLAQNLMFSRNGVGGLLRYNLRKQTQMLESFSEGESTSVRKAGHETVM